MCVCVCVCEVKLEFLDCWTITWANASNRKHDGDMHTHIQTRNKKCLQRPNVSDARYHLDIDADREGFLENAVPRVNQNRKDNAEHIPI